MSLLSSTRAAVSHNDVAKRAYHLLRRRYPALRELKAYVPYSSGGLRQLSDLTFQAVNRTLPLLDDVARLAGAPRAQRSGTEEFWRRFGGPDASELGALFDRYGSDKAGRHDYYLAYTAILGDLGRPSAMLEIGLGSNNTDVPSNMGSEGSPGASLRAFRDFLPGCRVFGADVDRRILFTEQRIETFQVDQTDAESMRALGESLPELDLVIDDGLHTPDANLAVLGLGLLKVRPGGWIVIEDISPAAGPLWEAVAGLLPGYECFIVESRLALVFCVRVPPVRGG